MRLCQPPNLSNLFLIGFVKLKMNKKPSRTRIRVRACACRRVGGKKVRRLDEPNNHAGFSRPTSKNRGWTRLGGWTVFASAEAFSVRENCAHDPWHKVDCIHRTNLNREVNFILLCCRLRLRLIRLRPFIKVFPCATGFAVLAPTQLAHRSR
jgi:hypothetical protein